MMSKGNAPNKAQRDWMAAVRELGSVISGGPAVIHHAVGRTGKHNKVHIGHWWLIPLTDEEHKDLHNGEIFKFKSRKDMEKRCFEDVCWMLEGLKAEFIPDEVYAAIMHYHK